MKLYECTYGTMVITDDLRVGHIVGLTYNVDISNTGNMNNDELFERTIPLVQFPGKTMAIHHSNIELFNARAYKKAIRG